MCIACGHKITGLLKMTVGGFTLWRRNYFDVEYIYGFVMLGGL